MDFFDKIKKKFKKEGTDYFVRSPRLKENIKEYLRKGYKGEDIKRFYQEAENMPSLPTDALDNLIEEAEKEVTKKGLIRRELKEDPKKVLRNEENPPTRREKIKGWGKKLQKHRGHEFTRPSTYIPLIIGIVTTFILWTLFSNVLNRIFFIGIIFLSLVTIFPKREELGIVKLLLRFLGILFLAGGLLLSDVAIASFLGFLVLFFGYISTPNKVPGGREEEEAHFALVPVMRTILGLSLVGYIALGFGGTWLERLPLTLISLGFFLSFPEAPKGGMIGEKLSVTIINTLHEKKDYTGILAAGSVLLGWLMGLWTLDFLSLTWIIFGVVGFVSLLVAFNTPPSQRGVVGAPLLIILILTMTSAYPSVMGEAVFGAWWPTAQQWGQGVTQQFQPMIDSFSQISGTFGKGWQCMASPATCYQQWQPSSTSEGPTTPIQISSLETMGINQLVVEDKTEKEFKSMAVVENIGDEKINEINFMAGEPKRLRAEEKEGITGVGRTNPEVGEVQKITGDESCEENECTYGPLYPGEPRQHVISYKITKLDKLKDGDYIGYSVNVKYPYNASATLDATIISTERADELAKKGELEFRTVSSKYTGGPVEIGLAATRKQPIRKDIEEIPLMVSLKNLGRGNISEIELVNVTFPENFGSSNGENYCDRTDEFKGDVGKLEKGETIKKTCNVNLEGLKGAPKKTFGLTAEVKYNYMVSKSNSIMVIKKKPSD